MEGGLVVGYMQINSLGGRGGTAGRTGMCGAVDLTVCAQRRPSFRISSSILSMPICASLCLSHSITRFSLLLLFFRTLALNLNSGSLGVSLLLMRPSLVNSYPAPLVDTEGGGAHHKVRGHHHKRNNNVWMGCGLEEVP